MGKLLEQWKQNDKRDEDTERMESDSEEREGMASEERQGHVTPPVSQSPRKQGQQENKENAALKKTMKFGDKILTFSTD